MPNQCVAPHKVTETVVALVWEISAMVGFVCTSDTINASPRSENINDVKTMYTFGVMENNSFSIDQVTAILNGKRVLDTLGEIHPLIKSCVFHCEYELIHAFADGNGRLSRMWQAQLLSKWKPLFTRLLVETLVCERQDEYYAVLKKSDSSASATPFIKFLLNTLRAALHDVVKTDQVNAQVSVQVKTLLTALGNETLSSNELMARVGLAHRGTFRKNHLQPAINLGLVEMTVPDKPNSRNQEYRAK